MSRPQKIHKPIKAPFNNILKAIAMGNEGAKHASPVPLSNKKPKIKPTQKK